MKNKKRSIEKLSSKIIKKSDKVKGGGYATWDDFKITSGWNPYNLGYGG